MKTRYFLFLSLLLAFLVFTGCSPNLNVKVASDNTVSMQFVSLTGEELTKTFTALTGQQVGQIDTSSTKKAMREAGLTPIAITQTGPDLQLTTGPDSIDSILSDCPGTNTATFAINSTPANGTSFSLTLSPAVAQYIVSLLPEETASYSELLMAPLFTGEIMSADEYTELIAAVYGQQLADELASSWFSLYLEMPGSVTSVSLPASLKANSVKNGNLANIFIPLSSLLTLSDAQSILVFFDKTKYTN